MRVRRAGLSWWVAVAACLMLVGAPLGLATSAAADPVAGVAATGHR